MTDYLELLLFAALTAGLMGGVHCGAMCGGIVGAVCNLQAGAPSGAKRWRYALAYNGGRIFSYTIAGALAGTLGQGTLWLRGGPAMQQALLFAAGLMLFVIALHVSGVTPVTRGIEAAGSVLWRHVQPYSRWFLPVNSMSRALGLGAVWGWLPCGMVYAVLLTAVATADPRMGALVMLTFGLGTLPNLLAIAFFVGRIGNLAVRGPIRIATALLIAGVGIFGILKAAQPALASDGWLCQAVPGLISIRP